MYLNEKTKRNYFFAMQAAKAELEKLCTEHSLISRYHREHWYQKLLHWNESQMLDRYYYLARVIDHIEAGIKEMQDALDNDRFARLQLEHQLKPFEGINLAEMELVQKELFR